MRNWVPPVLLVVIVAWEAIRESGQLTTGDVFWHLRTGDLILSDGLPRHDPFSWTAGAEAWHLNAWLGDVVWAGTRSLFGQEAVSLLGGISVIGIALLLYRACRFAGAGAWAAVGAAAAALLAMAPFIAPRPLLLGFVLMLLILEAAGRYRHGSTRSIIVVGVVAALWSNLHASFVTGVGVVALVAVG